MTNYEKIKYLLEMNVYEGVEVHADEKKPLKGLFKFYSIDGKLVDGEGFDWYEKDFDKLKITSITPIIKKPNLLPVGTKVRVASEYAKTRGRKEDIERNVEEADNRDGGYSLESERGYYFCPARAVIPLFDNQ